MAGLDRDSGGGSGGGGGSGRPWRSLNHQTDPTLNADNSDLDRERLLASQIYGYDKFDPRYKSRDDDDLDTRARSKMNDGTYNDYWRKLSTKINSPSRIGFAGGEAPWQR